MKLTTLHPIPPYNFPLILNLLSRYHVAVDLSRSDHNEYWRTLRIGENLALVRVTNAGTVDTPQLDVDLMVSYGEPDHSAVVQMVQHILSTDVDWQPFYAYARRDTQLWNIIEPVVGIRVVRAASAFEALATTIIEQQISLRAAHKALRWLAQWAGENLFYGEPLYAFPKPAQVATATIDELRPLKITFKRMALLIDVARRTASGELPLEQICTLSPHDAYRELQSIKGIGHWTAALTLIRTRGDLPFVLHNDVGLQAAVNTSYFNLPARATPETVIEVFNRYGEFAGLAAEHVVMRRVLDFF